MFVGWIFFATARRPANVYVLYSRKSWNCDINALFSFIPSGKVPNRNKINSSIKPNKFHWLVYLKFERALKFTRRSRSCSNSNEPIRVEDRATLQAAVVADPCTTISGKPKRRILRQFFLLHESFDRRSTQVWSEIYRALWSCWFYCDSGLFPLRRKRFVEWRLASDGWSGLPFHSFRRRSNCFK